MSSSEPLADPPREASTREALPVDAKYAGYILEVGPMVPEMLEAGVLVLFGEQAPAELREIAIVHNGRQLAEPITHGDMLVLGNMSCVITAVGGMANENLAELGHIVIKANCASETDLPGEISVEPVVLRVPAVGAELAILSCAVASGQFSASSSSTPAAHTPPASADSLASTSTASIKQRRTPWGFLSAWLNSRRRVTRSA